MDGRSLLEAFLFIFLDTAMASSRAPLLFRYPGGKHYAIDILRPFWEAVLHEEYREPFAGGGSIFFNKPPAKSSWLNDIDKELVTTYATIADPEKRGKLSAKLTREVASPARWREVLDSRPQSELGIAFKYFYLNRTSFSGKLVSPAWGYRPKRSLPPDRWHERIEECGVKLAGVKFTSLDFSEVIKAPSKNRVLLYVDPPYFLPPKRKHYRHGLDLADHERLSDCLRKTSHSFFLTYDDAPAIRELYKWAYIYPVNFIYRVENSATQDGVRRSGFELVITNFKLKGFENI